MSQQLNSIKKRIKSVNGTYKVTNAMKLVSTVKLKKWKSKMLSNKEYSLNMQEISKVVIKHSKKVNSPFVKENKEASKNLYLIISSTLGLCGSYNHNIFKVADVALKEEDDAIILGQKGLMYYQEGKFNKINDFSDYHSITDEGIIREIVNFISKKYANKEYREVHIIYTEFKNSLVFLAKDYKLLPLMEEVSEEEEEDSFFEFPPLLEPSSEELIDTLIPYLLQDQIYGKLLESEVCEQAARSNAMESATDNAKEILDELNISFNKARQAAITQEITEIVGAANAV